MEDTGKKKKTEVPVEQASATSISSSKENLSSLSVDELETLLNEVLEQEDYLRAIAIRDELKKRKR